MQAALTFINKNRKFISMWTKTSKGINVYYESGRVFIFEKV